MATYKCRMCGAEFDEPHVFFEHHGFTSGPYEKWSVCPECGDTDYDYAREVNAE